MVREVGSKYDSTDFHYGGGDTDLLENSEPVSVLVYREGGEIKKIKATFKSEEKGTSYEIFLTGKALEDYFSSLD